MLRPDNPWVIFGICLIGAGLFVLWLYMIAGRRSTAPHVGYQAHHTTTAGAGRGEGGSRPTPPPAPRGAPDVKVAPQPIPLARWWRAAIDHATHVGLVGESQSGKSTTARALLVERARTDEILIIDPHEKLNDWAGLPVVGADYDKAACAAAIQALEVEMKRRYKRDEAIGAPITVFIDEYPSIVADFPHVRGPFTRLLREAAKVKIRLVVLMQDPSVRTLGIDGEGSVRECFIKILLGSFAAQACPGVAFGARPAALDMLGRPAPVLVEGLREVAQQPVSAAMWAVPSAGTDTGTDGVGEALARSEPAGTSISTSPEPVSEPRAKAIRAALDAGLSRNQVAAIMSIGRAKALEQIAAALEQGVGDGVE